MIQIDRERAATPGWWSTSPQTLQRLAGGRYGYFIKMASNTKSSARWRGRIATSRSTYRPSSSAAVRATLIQLDNVITVSESSSPPQLFRYNRYVAATVSAGLNPGYTIGEANRRHGQDRRQSAPTKLLHGLGRRRARFLRELVELAVRPFLLALVLIYLVLAAQFESFRDPFIIMLTVPLAVAGALLSLWYFNRR